MSDDLPPFEGIMADIAGRVGTLFTEALKEQMKDPEFAREYEAELARLIAEEEAANDR